MVASSLQTKGDPARSLIDRIMKDAGISSHPEESPSSFVLELHVAWKKRAPKLRDGKPAHSDRQLAEWIIELNDEVKSLTPKLRGRTKLRPEDAGVLVAIFLLLWNHDSSLTGARVEKVEREQYEPMLPDDEIEIARNYIVNRVSAEQTWGDDSLQSRERVRDSSEAILENFEKARVLITLSPQSSSTFIPRDPKNMYRGFRDQVDQLWQIARSSDQPHILIWIFSLGNQTFRDDGGSQARLFDLQSLA